MKTKNAKKTQEIIERAMIEMENDVLSQVSYLTKSFFGKGLRDVDIKRLSDGLLRVTFNFDLSTNEIVRVCAGIVKEDDGMFYRVSVYNAVNQMTFLAFCMYKSDFTETLSHQCVNLAELPF